MNNESTDGENTPGCSAELSILSLGGSFMLIHWLFGDEVATWYAVIVAILIAIAMIFNGPLDHFKPRHLQ